MEACDQYKSLIMGLIDNELTPKEAADVNHHLTRCAACREEYEQLRKTSARIGVISYIEPDDEILESLWKPPYSRFSRISGLVLVIGGWAALICFMLYQFLICSSGRVFSKISIAAIVLGFLIILISSIRERVIKYRSDPYKEVIR